MWIELSFVGILMMIVGFALVLLKGNWINKYMIIGIILSAVGFESWLTITKLGQQEHMALYENNYQSLKPSLDLKPCPELERIMSYSSNQSSIDMAKRNYNERCL